MPGSELIFQVASKKDLNLSTQEKRQEMRIACNKPVQVMMANSTPLLMTALNYSMSGVGITGSIYQLIPHVGEQLNVRFTLDATELRQVNINGTVKYINLDGGVYYLGLGL